MIFDRKDSKSDSKMRASSHCRQLASASCLALACLTTAAPIYAESSSSETDNREQRIQQLEQSLEQQRQKMAEQQQQLELLADQIYGDNLDMGGSAEAHKNSVHIGGYGEMHYRNLKVGDEDFKELDFHRMVLFFGYDFNERIRFITELEVEHSLVSASSRGAVELEQAYIEIDINPSTQVKTGVMLVPLGMINETHEPPTFYGVERPVIETTIIPSTWYSAGVMLSRQFDNGFSADLFLSEGLKTPELQSPDGTKGPFVLKSGKQKASFSAAFDLATTARVKYRGIPGLELSAFAQYQPDLDQSAKDSYADDALLLGGHVIYQLGNVTTKALYARWDVEGDAAAAAGMDLQDGGYVEAGWRLHPKLGVFARHSMYSQQRQQDATQSDIGFNYYVHENVVFKGDIQIQNEDAGDASGFNLGMGYQF